jgi:SAM-dependent methyltransferase
MKTCTYDGITWDESMEIDSVAGLPVLWSDLKSLTSRCDVSHVLNKHGLIGEVAEIGVDMGHYASAILGVWNGKVYHAVDLWTKQDPRIYIETHFDHEASFNRASELAHNDKRVELIRLHSVTASALFENNRLDWVWIDANHEYRPVMDDMNAWYRTVKPGGIFSGHDYYSPGVRRAVNEWMNMNKVRFVYSADSWWSVK